MVQQRTLFVGDACKEHVGMPAKDGQSVDSPSNIVDIPAAASPEKLADVDSREDAVNAEIPVGDSFQEEREHRSGSETALSTFDSPIATDPNAASLLPNTKTRVSRASRPKVKAGCNNCK